MYYAVPLANVNDVPDYEIRVARPENRESRPLARIPGGRIPSAGWTIHPVLSPDDKTIAVLLADGAGINIWALPASGGNLRQITDFGPRRTLIARRVSWSSDSRFVVAAVGESDADIVLLDALALGR
jgi:Tol biopolymer transport system component